ncbi:MAG: acyltransferase family protein [Ilumatobacteraceae bacterium]
MAEVRAVRTHLEPAEIAWPRWSAGTSPSASRRANRRQPIARMGYQPGLDGLRGFWLFVVMGYHAGFSWMHGGYVSLELFFVLSGYLITTLLLEERERSRHVQLGQFWLRRAKRLLPALAVMLVGVSIISMLIGEGTQLDQLRTDLPWATFYVGNWGQILGDVPYYADTTPLLRHLWSLAIEEQFYLLWPLAFVALTLRRVAYSRCARLLAALAIGVMATTFLIQVTGPGLLFGDVERTNFLYLSTLTRSSGLLLGVAAAFVWRPWRARRRAWSPQVGSTLDVFGALAIIGLACLAAVSSLTDGYVYQWALALISLLALVAVLVVVHPASRVVRRLFGWKPLVLVGQRSYGIYLWHWPIFIFMGATDGSVVKLVPALIVTFAVAEVSYRYIEEPVRRGGVEKWWRRVGPVRGRRLLLAPAAGLAVFVAVLVSVDADNPAVGGAATFELPTSTIAPTAAVAPVGAGSTVPAAPAVAGPVLPVGLTIVGDSLANALASNLPEGLESTFDVTNGGILGCSVYDSGSPLSAYPGFELSFDFCEGWREDWAQSMRESGDDLALVVVGGWDIFDHRMADGTVLTFASPEWQTHFTTRLQEGIAALKRAGATKIGLLEVACMRPQDVPAAGIPPLPERADDGRVAHVNAVLQQVAASDPGWVSFVEGPKQWCTDPVIASDLAMRWDGVHPHRPGAKLIYETIAPELLSL